MIADPWLPVSLAALAVGRPVRTVRTWMNRGKVPVVCDVRSHELLVHLPSLGDYARSAEARFGCPEHAHRRRQTSAA